MDRKFRFPNWILCALASIVVFSVSACLIAGACCAEEPKIEITEKFSVMVMSDYFENITGKIKFTVMNWTEKDESQAYRDEEVGRPATMGEIWLASVPLEAVTVVEKDGMSGFDWAEAHRMDGRGNCSKVLLKVARKVDVAFWNSKLDKYKKDREDFLKNPILPPPTTTEDNFPFASIKNYPSEEYVVIREYMGQDKTSNSPLYKAREVRLDGLDVNLRTDGAWWNSVRCVGALEVPKNASISGRYKQATLLLRFDERKNITRFRENFVRWREAHEMYKRDHGLK